MHAERNPSADECESAKRRDHTDRVRGTDAKRIKAAAEKHDADDEAHGSDAQPAIDVCARQPSDDEQHERMPELVFDPGVPDRECAIVEHAAQRVGTERAQHDSEATRDGSGTQRESG